MAQGFALTISPRLVLRAGLLTRKFSKKNFEPREREAEFERLAERRNEKKYGSRELGIAEAVAEMAEGIGRSAAQVSLNWGRQKSSLPIIGTSHVSQIVDRLAALRWTLTEQEMQVLDEAS